MEVPPPIHRELNKRPLHAHYEQQNEFYRRALEREDVKRYRDRGLLYTFFGGEDYTKWREEKLGKFKPPPNPLK